MNKIKNILNTILSWGKKNIVNFIATIILSLAVAIVTQFTAIKALGISIEQNSESLTVVQNKLNGLEDDQDELSGVVKNNFDALSSRIDTVESTIDPEKKRRKLIAKIRDAINENTNRNLDIRSLNAIANAVIDYSYLYDFTIPQVLAQMRVESNFDAKAKSSAGAEGIMQIVPDTMRLVQYDMRDGPSRLNVWNIHHSVRAGCFYLRQQITRFGSYEEGLRAYNWGPHNLARYNSGERKDIPDETSEYVPKIKSFIEIFEKYGLE
jgi:hypothetical protein